MRIHSVIFTCLLSVLSISSFAAPITLEGLFQLQLNLRKQATSENIDVIKKQMTELRYQKDLLGELAVKLARRPLTDRSPEAFGPQGILMVRPGMPREVQFESGDVILMRGTSTISTTIATMADVETQFSHILMIYKLPTTGEFVAMEALIDQGTIVHPLRDVLSEGSPRLVVYRHPDRALAAEAARMGYEHAMSYIARGVTKPYDFKFNMTNYDEVYCPEWIRRNFDLASQGRLLLPTYPTTLGNKFAGTLKSLGMPARSIVMFAPYDIDFEPSFELVYEWFDPGASLSYRIKDKILSKLFQWIESGAVRYDFSKFISTGGSVVNLIRDPNAKSEGINPVQVKAFTQKADEVMAALTLEILKVNDQKAKVLGRNLSADEISAYLESIKNHPALWQVLQRSGFSRGVIR